MTNDLPPATDASRMIEKRLREKVSSGEYGNLTEALTSFLQFHRENPDNWLAKNPNREPLVHAVDAVIARNYEELRGFRPNYSQEALTHAAARRSQIAESGPTASRRRIERAARTTFQRGLTPYPIRTQEPTHPPARTTNAQSRPPSGPPGPARQPSNAEEPTVSATDRSGSPTDNAGWDGNNEGGANIVITGGEFLGPTDFGGTINHSGGPQSSKPPEPPRQPSNAEEPTVSATRDRSGAAASAGWDGSKEDADTVVDGGTFVRPAVIGRVVGNDGTPVDGVFETGEDGQLSPITPDSPPPGGADPSPSPSDPVGQDTPKQKNGPAFGPAIGLDLF